MHDSNLNHSALVLAGHGSSQTAESAASVYQHGAELRDRGLFGEVKEAFYKQPPFVQEVMEGLSQSEVFVVPMFISEGYFSEDVIPKLLGFEPAAGTASRARRIGGKIVRYCRVIGTHDEMTAVLLARARAIVQKFPFPQEPAPEDTTLFIAGHGTERNENSRKAIERQVRLIQERSAFASVHAVFMEESPRIADAFELSRTRNIVVVPFFMSDGMHVREDIPVLLGEPERVVRQRLEAGQSPWRNPTERKGKLVWYAASVGTEPLIADVIIERVREAASWATAEQVI